MKKALIICYYWPPAGGPGVQRWLKFVSYLKEFGIEPIVYVPKNPSYPLLDENLVSEIPKNITILKHPIKEPYKIAALFSKKKTRQISSGIISKEKPTLIEKLLLFVRGNLFIPDARVGWVAPSVTFLKEYLSTHQVDCIITSGPPHSLHLIGMALQKQIKKPWIADFRDPWTTIHYHKSLRLTKASALKHKKLESLVLNKADHILVTSPSTKKECSLLTKKPITLITNGFDTINEVVPSLDKKFSIAHIGSLLTERNPLLFWEVLSEIALNNQDFASDFEITLAGVVSDEVLTSIASFGLTNNITLKGYVPHKVAIKLQHSAQILLLLEMDTQETKAIIPGKLFEYLQARRPIIALGPDGSDVQGILEDTASGCYIAPTQKDRLHKQILLYYRAYKNGTLSVPSNDISAFTRKSLTKRLAGVIKTVVNT
jgi:glycosyltransferase involved in cell wall biosynthesis